MLRRLTTSTLEMVAPGKLKAAEEFSNVTLRLSPVPAPPLIWSAPVKVEPVPATLT